MRNIQTEKGDSGIYCDEDYYESDDESDYNDESGEQSNNYTAQVRGGNVDQEQAWFGSKQPIPEENKQNPDSSDGYSSSSGGRDNDQSQYDEETDRYDS
tara:strand:+ start:1705 stop:2001 length:297 start_codon:yes stop_codon:yes gene_type:complete